MQLDLKAFQEMKMEPKNWKTFLWAATQHEEFCCCQVVSPLYFKFQHGWHRGAGFYSIALHWRKPYIFIPWKVENAHRKALGLICEYDEDDIPF